MKWNNTWLEARKQDLNALKQQVNTILGAPPKDLVRYKKNFQNSLPRKWKVVDREKLISEIQEAEVVLGADFHAFAQSQRTHLRILRELNIGRPIILMMECFETRHNKWIQKYLRNEITEAVFLKKINWDNWGFSFSHYKPLLELAKVRGYEVLGLNLKSQNLSQRDKWAAEAIVAELNKSNKLVYVIYGEYHLSKNHLPLQLKKISKSKLKTVTVFQNSESVYFQLARQGKDLTTDVVKMNHGVYSIQSSPPWSQWESYLLHLQSQMDYDIDEIDPHDSHITFLFRQIDVLKKELKWNITTEDLNIVEPTHILQGVGPGIKSHELKKLLISGESFVWPEQETVFLTKWSMNVMAHVCGQWMYLKKNNQKQSPLKKLIFSEEDFYKAVWIESVGFMLSKILNPNRKIKDDLLRQSNTESLLVNLRESSIQARQWSSYYRLAQHQGFHLGEKLFWLYRGGKKHRSLVVGWLNANYEDLDLKLVFGELNKLSLY